MILTLIALGLILGRWWRFTLVAGALVWPLVLVADGVMNRESGLLGAAALAVANTGVGILVHQAALQSVRLIRQDRASVV